MTTQRYHVLVVDDEAPIRKLIAGALRRQNCDCDDVADGEHAARLAAQSRYDLVITDLKMPHKNGHALAIDLLQQHPRPIVVVHTGVLEPRLANDLLTRGVDEIIYKPTDFSTLASRVSALLERRTATGFQRMGGAADFVSADKASVQSALSLPMLNQRMANISTVLPVSTTALDVYEMTRNDKWQIPQIAAAIQRDASLTADVLRLANSALYNTSGRRIISLDDAVLRIGQKHVGELALAANALAKLTPALLPWMDLELTWKRSMAAGIAMESVVEAGGHQAIENGLLLSAIMYPLGRVALAMLFPDQYSAMASSCRQTGEPLQEQERKVFPITQSEIIAQLLSTWRIPSDVFLPLRCSSDDYSAVARLSEPARTRIELLKVSIVLGRLAVGRWEPWDYVEFPPSRVLQRLRLRDAEHIIRTTRADLDKIADFHPGRSATKSHRESPKVGRAVSYCSLGNEGADLLRELLPSLGLEPQLCTLEEIRGANTPSIVNCLSASANSLDAGEAWKSTTFVMGHEARDDWDRSFDIAVLPNGFGRFRSAIGECMSEKDAAPGARSLVHA
jgi:HD-like signal output (HDOD) protein/ActR/RegA family two-component response regulator